MSDRVNTMAKTRSRRIVSMIVGLCLAAQAGPRGVAFRVDGSEDSLSRTRMSPFHEPIQPPRPVQVMVHRGLSQQAPENTRPAVMMCIADGLEWVEIDVRLTKDGVHVLAHDERVERTTNGTGLVRDFASEELQVLDAGTWFARRYAGTRLLTLAEVLELAKGRINLYLDCKDVNPEKLVADVLAAGMERQVVVYGDRAKISRVRELSKGRIALMVKWHPALGFDDWIDRVRPAAVEIDADEITPLACQAFHKNGIKVQAKTLGPQWDCPQVWARVIAAGVDWIQTDLPHEVLLQSLRAREISSPVRIAFHRGASRYAPENTIPAVEKAMALGADYIELDIRTSEDGRFFLLHDARLDRTTNGTGPLRALSGDELVKLNAGSWFGRPFANAKIPTFDEVLAKLHGGQSHVYVDAKDIPPEALLALLEKHDMLERSVVYQGPTYLKRLKALNGKVRLLPPLRDPSRLDQLAVELKPYGVDTDWKILSRELVQRCHAHGILVFSDALGNHETLQDYTNAINWGVDVIQTDFPARSEGRSSCTR